MVSEEKGGNVIHSFGFAYTNKSQEVKWIEDAAIATKSKDGSWTFDVSKVKDLDQNQFETYKTMLAKITQVIETNGTNLAGIKAVKK